MSQFFACLPAKELYPASIQNKHLSSGADHLVTDTAELAEVKTSAA